MSVPSRAAAVCTIFLSVASLANLSAANDLRLIEAAKNQDKDTVRVLLQQKQKIDVNTAQPDGATALHWAAHWDDIEIADLLIRAGAAVNVANDYSVTPLSLACTNGSARMVDLLLNAGANPKAVLATGETALMTAARAGNPDVVKALLGAGADVNAKDNLQGHTALMWAAAETHADVVQALIAQGADVHARSTTGFTPLLFAARKGGRRVTEILLGAGANVNQAALDGTTALLVATMRGHLDHARFLLDQGADPNLGAGVTVLQWAAGEWPDQLTGSTTGITATDNEWKPLGGLLQGSVKTEFVKTLLAHGADPNASSASGGGQGGRTGRRGGGETPFLLAARAGDAAVMRLLAANGADPLAVSPQKNTALMLAARLGSSVDSWATEAQFLEAATVALELGSDVNAVNTEGETALHGSAYNGCDTIIRFLVEHGADVNVKDKHRWTPLTIAEGVNRNPSFPTTAALLRQLGADPTPPDVERIYAKVTPNRPVPKENPPVPKEK